MRQAVYGLASGTVLAAAAAWFLSTPRTLPPSAVQPAVAVPAPVLQEAAQPVQNVAAQLQPPIQQAEPGTSRTTFEARFKASREAPRPAPDQAILQARSFPEAFQAMKRAEGRSPVVDARANPFEVAR